MLRKKPTNYLRVSILLLILPVMYLALWVSISGDDTLIYAEQVLKLRSYLPEFAHNLRMNALIFSGMCAISTTFAFLAWRHSESRKMQNFSMIICALAAVLTIWFLMSLV